MKRQAVLVALVVLASGCALNQSQYRLVEPGVRAVDGVYRVDSRLAWSSLPNGGKVETWTLDGLSLDSLRFFKGIADGETMLAERANDIAAARFRASMTPVETVEFVVDSLYGARSRPGTCGRCASAAQKAFASRSATGAATA